MTERTARTTRELRRDCRYPCAADVELSNLITQTRVPGRMIDLSVSGCLVRPAEADRFRSNDFVELSFTAHQLSIRVTGYVRHLRQDLSMGIEFLARNDDCKRRILRLVSVLAEEWIRNQRAGGMIPGMRL